MKRTLLAAVISVAFVSGASAATGWNFSYNYIFNGASDVFYDLNGTGIQPAGNFNGAALGTYDTTLSSGVGSSLFLNAQINAWQSDTDNYSNFSLWYRVYSGTATGSFTQVSAPTITSPGPGAGDRRGLATGVDLLTGRANGTWTVETYLSRTWSWDGGGPLTDYLRVGGSQGSAPTSDFFTATYEVIPEPSTYALLSLAAAGLGAHVIRRRRSRK